MEIVSPIHGKIIYEENEVITFEKGIPGFQNLKKFVVKEVGDDTPFNILQSIEDKEIGFILISPFAVYDDYEIKLNDEILNSLKIETSEDVLLFSIVTLSSNINEITANLKAPLIINIRSKKGQQYIIDKDIYKIKEKVFR
ncbi:MAG: flagellar assembly protein FliW [Clostridium sartagoforme]|nr:flagellar assembly protein FliW [Clostridium sartagoforme]